MPRRKSTVEAADRFHSAAIHALRHVRREDPTSGLSAARLSALSVLVFGGPRTLGELALAELQPAFELLVDGGGEARDLTVLEVARERERRQLRVVEDLVRPSAADAGDDTLVAEQRVEPPRVGAQNPPEPLR